MRRRSLWYIAASYFLGHLLTERFLYLPGPSNHCGPLLAYFLLHVLQSFQASLDTWPHRQRSW